MSDIIETTRRRGWRSFALWGIQGALAAVFLAAGLAKLIGVDALIEMFARVGWGQCFRILTGLLEIAGAVLILLPRWAFTGALLLGCIMAGAIAANLALKENPIGAVILGGLAIIVLWARRPTAGGQT